MRVLDNLENYDIPSGFHLTEEQEEQLAADLKEIVLALIPLRSSKLKTRQYFNSHLRTSQTVRQSTQGQKHSFLIIVQSLPNLESLYRPRIVFLHNVADGYG